MKERIVSWSDYIYIGMALAVMMSARNEYQDGFYQVILVAAFFVITGFKDNIRLLTQFIKKFPVYAVITAAWTVYFYVFNRVDLTSYRFPITVFFIVYAGYAVSRSGREAVSKGLEKLWLLLFVLLSIGVLNYLIVHDSEVYMSMFFLHHIPEGDAAIVMMLISMFYTNDIRKKISGILLAFVVGVTGSSRLATVVMCILVLAYLIIVRERIATFIKYKLNVRRKDKVRLIIFSAIVFIAVIIIIASRIDLILSGKLLNRYVSALSSITKDVYLDVYGDVSYRIRIIAPEQTLAVFRSGNFWSKIFGGGMLYGYYSIKTSMTLFTNTVGTAAGPIENTFISLLSDYGFAALILYFGIFLLSIKTAIVSKDYYLKAHAIFVVAILTVSAFIDMEYWINLAFFVWVFIGIFLGELEYKADESMLETMICSTICALGLLELPTVYSFIRTIISVAIIQNNRGGAVCYFALLLLALGLAIWTVSTLLSNVILRKKTSRNNLIIASLGLAAFACLVVVGNNKIKSTRDLIKNKVESQKEILLAVQDKMNGRMYSDYLPKVYNAEIGGIEATLFSAASLAATPDATVIMNVEDEAQLLIRKGFLYQPIDDTIAIYTNDSGSISALKELGYNPKGYYSYEKHVDLKSLATQNGLQITESGSIILEGADCDLVEGPEADIYPGIKTVTYSLKVNDDNYTEDFLLCKLIIKQKGEDKELVSESIQRSMFNNAGELTYDLTFSGSGADCEFLVDMKSDDVLEISDISYVKTPEYDTHYRFDKEGRIIREEYFDLEGNPLALSGGQGAVEYEYDEAGNRIVERYYDVNNEPMLFRGQFWYVQKTYNELRQNILEQYFGLDYAPAILSDGASGYKREYDEDGNAVITTCIGEAGNPVLNTSGYASVRRTFDKDKRIIKEEYLDTEQRLIELAKGQASVEYEYDEAGNRVTERYYDTMGNPILYNGQYYCVRRKFNEKKQNIFEEFFGIDDTPIALSDGAYGYRREYDNADNVAVTEYIGADGEPALNTSGYAMLRRSFNDKKQIVREEYYNENEQPIVLSGGQAAVEYEYDEAGNRTVNRYYDANYEPVLYNGQYWYNETIYNDLRQNILEKFYGIEGKPILLPDGAAGYRRKYDENGNISAITYLGEDGNPTINISGFSTWHRFYNEKKQIVREEYYDVKNEAVTLLEGQGAVEYEYDEAGNRIIDRYYDASGNPILYAGEYWYLVRTFNDKKQCVHEDYYGLDDKRILRSAGYCSVDIKYDEGGTIVGKTYFSLDGEVVAEE